VQILIIQAAIGASCVSAIGGQTLATGFLKQEVFSNIAGSAVSDLTGSQKYMDNQPDSVAYLGNFEAQSGVGSDYGQRLSGLLAPCTTGDYVFFIASDDQSELWLSTDDNPANKQLLASVSGWTNSREWGKYPDAQNNAASPVHLEAGKGYYIEALMKQGGGGDNLAVGWVQPGLYVDPDNAPDGLTNIAVIPAKKLGGYLDKLKSSITITKQPTNTIGYTTLAAFFSVAATGTSDLGSILTYQWKRDGTEIPGATLPVYSTPVLTLADNGARFSMLFRQVQSFRLVATERVCDIRRRRAYSAGRLVQGPRRAPTIRRISAISSSCQRRCQPRISSHGRWTSPSAMAAVAMERRWSLEPSFVPRLPAPSMPSAFLPSLPRGGLIVRQSGETQMTRLSADPMSFHVARTVGWAPVPGSPTT
jgi:hypothetical protein